MHDRSRLSFFAALSLLTLGWAPGPYGPYALFQERPSPMPEKAPEIRFEKYQLPNGLEVILSVDHRLPMVAVNLWYHVGPANEEAGRTGFAHLFEHMMFQGSKHVDSHIKLLELAGASDINGTTDFDRTNYFETLPASELELALWLESDRMGYLLDRIDQANLSNQQDVVRNERRQSVENQPYGMVEEAMIRNLFPPTHPYHANVIGSHADIQAVRLEDVHKFFKLYYAPNNASLAIVGDIDLAATRKLVEKYFGSLRPGPDVPRIAAATPPLTSERRVTVKDRVELPRVYLAWLTSPIFKEGDADADVAASVLGGGKSSRLFKKLVYEKQIAQDVSAQQYSLALRSVFSIQVTGRPGHTVDEIQAALDEELDRFRREGPEESEVERAQNMVETRIVLGLERLGGFGGIADRLNLYNHFLGRPDYLAQDLARYRQASSASVLRFAQEQLKPNARVVVHGVPGEPDLGPAVPAIAPAAVTPGASSASVNPDEPWRSQRPEPSGVRPLRLPVPSSFTLPNGLTVILNERPELPVVAANLVVRTGSDANPADKPGLANFAAAMLDEGTESRSAMAIADEVAQLGASLLTLSSMDATTVSVRSLRRSFPQMLDLLADVVLRPSFPEEEVARQRASRLASLLQQLDNPAVVSSRIMSAALYGAGHPYGFAEIGTEEAIRAVTRQEMAAFWRRSFVPNNAALIVAGSIGQAELRALAEKAFSAWERGTPGTPNLAEPSPTERRVVVVDKPGAPQTQLRVATLGAPRATPDYEVLQVLNAALGGTFSSRINMNLRERQGYTYGAYSAFVYRRAPGPFFISTGVRTDVTAPAVAEIFREIRKIGEAAVSAEELQLALGTLVRSLPGEFETGATAAATFSNLYIYGLPLDYYEKFPARASAVTADAVLAAARRYLLPEKMIVVAVGDRVSIEPELKKLALGPVEVRDARGELKP